MRAELISELSGLDAIEADWRRLATSTGNAFLTPEWYRAWVTGDADELLPAVVVARRDDGEVCGVLPLVLDGGARPHALRFAGSGFGDRFGIAAADEDQAEVAGVAIEALESAGIGAMLVLHRIDADRDWPLQMAEASRRRLAVVESSTAELPHIPAQGLDWDGYVAGRSKKFGQRIARGLERALDRDGVAHVVRETSDPGSLDDDLGILFRLHDMRHEGGDSSIASPRTREALSGFARAALERGWLRLRVLELDREAAAAILAWRIGPSYSIYQTGFDPAWADRSAGMLLFKETVRSAIEEGADDVDFLLGTESYKWRFVSDARPVRTLILVGAIRPARLLASAEALARRIGRRLAPTSRLGRAARRVARALPGGDSPG